MADAIVRQVQLGYLSYGPTQSYLFYPTKTKIECSQLWQVRLAQVYRSKLTIDQCYIDETRKTRWKAELGHVCYDQAVEC